MQSQGQRSVLRIASQAGEGRFSRPNSGEREREQPPASCDSSLRCTCWNLIEVNQLDYARSVAAWRQPGGSSGLPEALTKPSWCEKQLMQMVFVGFSFLCVLFVLVL